MTSNTQSRVANGVAVKIYFQPNANIQTALAQAGYLSTFCVCRQTTPPLVITIRLPQFQ